MVCCSPTLPSPSLTCGRLAPHESDTTDVILAGHSLGGILGAEVVLMPPQTSPDRLFQHRILGLIAFDTPFLGMHPGVVGTGIASLFRAPPELAESPLAALSPFSDPASAGLDHTYNPSYPNDVRLANRQGKLQRAWYFWNKHAGELTKAASDYVSSHLEFGGCLADYSGLKKRYHAVRALEDVNELMKPLDPDGHLMKRVRFVNYYSASTGPIKERSPSPNGQHTLLDPAAAELQDSASEPSSGTLTTESLPLPSPSSPQISLEEQRDVDSTGSTAETDTNPKSSADLVEHALGTLSLTSTENEQSWRGYEGSIVEDEMPPLPELPERPPDFDPSRYDDEDSSRLFQKAHEREVKVYERALKDRERSIKEREKYVQKRQREATKQKEKAERQMLKQEARFQKERSKTPPASTSAEAEGVQQDTGPEQNKSKAANKQKDRKFCVLPKDPHTKQTDLRWIRVYMEGIDEVVAHTSLFKVGDTYVKMVGDTVERIEKWVQEDHSTRMILADLNGETWEDLD